MFFLFFLQGLLFKHLTMAFGHFNFKASTRGHPYLVRAIGHQERGWWAQMLLMVMVQARVWRGHVHHLLKLLLVAEVQAVLVQTAWV